MLGSQYLVAMKILNLSQRLISLWLSCTSAGDSRGLNPEQGGPLPDSQCGVCSKASFWKGSNSSGRKRCLTRWPLKPCVILTDASHHTDTLRTILRESTIAFFRSEETKAQRRQMICCNSKPELFPVFLPTTSLCCLP